MQSLPHRLDTDADRSHQPDPGYRDLLLHSPLPAALAIPASVREAMAWMNTGPITRLAAMPPIRGQRGPGHSCTITMRVPSATWSTVQSTSIPVVIPLTCR